MGMLRALVSCWLLLSAVASTVAAQGRSLHWRGIAVEARLDAEGRLHVRERQAMVFTGDWNGGQRTFRVAPRQRFEFESLSRIDPVTGTPRAMVRGDLDVVDGYDFTSSRTLRWRSRLPTDRPFDATELVYVIEFSYSNLLVPTDSGYVLDHDFAVTDREGNIEDFTLTLQLDSAWSAPLSFRGTYQARNLPPGEGFVVRVPLRYAATGRPAAVEFGAGPVARVALLLLLLAGVYGLGRRFLARERALGRFEPLIPVGAIDRKWLEERVLAHPPEVVGAAWDATTGAPEVTAVLARLEAEGKLTSEVEKKGWKIFSSPVLHLKLLVPRNRLNDYERALIDSLFLPGRDVTSTDEVRARYQKSGFDPASKIKAPLQRLANQLSSSRASVPKPGWRPTLLLLLAAVVLLIIGIVRRPFDALIVGPGAIIGIVLYIIAVIAASVWRLRVHRLRGPALVCLVPMGLIVGGIIVLLLGATPPAGFFVLAGLVTIALALVRSVLNQAMSRESAERIAFRKRLASAREYFLHQLEQPHPALRDEWFPWLIAFGLANHMDQWFRAFGGDAARSGATWVPSSSGSDSSGGTGGCSGFGGGGGFSGGGASAAWTAAAGSLAAGVSAPSSSGSGGGGGGGGGGGSSGGGGGGGW